MGVGMEFHRGREQDSAALLGFHQGVEDVEESRYWG
jgi:hypothetical protein